MLRRVWIFILANTTFNPNSCFSAYLLAQRRPLKLELCVRDFSLLKIQSNRCQYLLDHQCTTFAQAQSTRHNARVAVCQSENIWCSLW